MTPSLGMFRGLRAAGGSYNVRLVLSTREPKVLVPLIESALGEERPMWVVVDMFSSKSIPDLGVEGGNVQLRCHAGRVAKEASEEEGHVSRERDVFTPPGVV